MEKKKECLLAPCTGKTVPLSAVPDEVFAGGLLGEGIGIEPTDGKFFAPVDGIITSITDTNHAMTLMSANGTDLLLHIGVDTVRLAGEGFRLHVALGDRITAGQPIADVDIALIRSRGLSAICSLVVTEPEKIENIEYHPGDCTGGKNAVMCYIVAVEGAL